MNGELDADALAALAGEDNQAENMNAQSLSNVSDLVRKLNDKRGELAAANELVKSIAAEITDIEMKQLPDAMDGLQMKKLTMADGGTIEVKDHVHANIKVENKPAAHAWLRDNGHGDLIKVEFSAQFQRGQEEEATKLLEYVKANFPPNVVSGTTEGVMWNTLTAWAKEQLGQAKSLPEQLLGIFRGRKAEVKYPKVKK